MVSQREAQEDNVRLTYSKIILLGLLLHVTQAMVFALLGCPALAVYNVMSVVFYIVVLWVVQRGHHKLVVSCVHVEICLFVSSGVYYCGWDLGMGLYLLALSSLVYFCPYEYKITPYLIAAGETLLYLLLRLYSWQRLPIYTHLTNEVKMWYYLFNAMAGFCIILFSAFSANISASVTNRRLRDENVSLSAMANHDYLTGLMSRRYFLSQSHAQAEGTPIVVAIGDLDDFKKVNDSYGHAVGDRVLHAVAQLLEQRSGGEVSLCRWGGEEFVLLFPNRTLEQAIAELEILRCAVAEHSVLHKGATINVTITFGAAAGQAGDDVLTLIDNADAGMYTGKLAGKNQVALIEGEQARQQ